jgi:hypothetical protein
VVHHCFRVLVIVVALASLLVVPALRQAPTAAANSAPPAANQSISFVGSIGGQLDTIAVAGALAYIGEGASLSIVDLSDPARPLRRSYLPLPDTPHDLALQGSLVFVALRSRGLQIIDVSDSDQPVLLGSYSNTRPVQQVAIAGSTAYLIEEIDYARSSLHILDVSDPAQPVALGSYNALEAGEDLAVAGGLAYVASSQEQGVRIIDVSTPATPTLRGSFTSTGKPKKLALLGQRAYVVEHAPNYDYFLRIVDVSNPAAPALRGSFPSSRAITAISVTGSTAYIAQIARSELLIVDVSDPAAPAQTGTYNAGAEITNVLATDGKLYLPTVDQLEIVDAAGASAPTLRGRYLSGNSISRFHPDGDLLYAIDDNHRLLIYDLSDPARPRLRGSYRGDDQGFSVRGGDVWVRGTIAYLVGDNRLQVIDVSDPAKPRLHQSYNNLSDAYRIQINGNFAYVLNYGEIWIFDVSDPANPVLRNNTRLPNGPSTDMHLDGDLLYVTVECIMYCPSSLYIIDVSNPMQPRNRGVATVSQVDQVKINGDFAYVTGYPLEVVDVSDLDQPKTLKPYRTPGEATGIDIAANRAYIADGSSSGLHVVDLADPGAPQPLATYKLPGVAERVVVSNNLVYLWSWSSGLYILRDSALPFESHVLLPMIAR